MNHSKHLCASLLIALLTGGVTVAHAGDLCRNVRFQITNQKNHAITITQVKYFNQTNNRLQTEAIRNIQCAAGATCVTKGDNLRDVTKGDNLRDSEGQDLTRFIFILKNEGGENRHETGVKGTGNPRCTADKTYGPFVITAND